MLSSTDGGVGKCISQMLTVMGLLLSHQEGLASAVIDCFNSQTKGKTDSMLANAANSTPPSAPGKKTPTSEEIQTRRVRQAIHKAEKSTVVFDLDMGTVPIINKDTLARKVTIALHDKEARCEQVRNGDITEADAEELSTTSSPAHHWTS
jgi:hypothetical protein